MPAPQSAPARESKAAEAVTAPTDGLATITAPMLGTFYRAEAPGKPPFVEVGARVEPDSIVCIIEVMKMMNSVTAGTAGTIAEVVPRNAELVEYGQPLFRVEPA
jgi:acetyl-CoA carboxylase biotin carboxyl carrier protein